MFTMVYLTGRQYTFTVLPLIHFIVGIFCNKKLKSEINLKFLEIILINRTFVFLLTLMKSSLWAIASFKAMGTSQPPLIYQPFR